MPLFKIERTGFQSAWGIWHITETESELAGDEECPPDITNVIKRTEWYAGRRLLRDVTEAAGLIYRNSFKDDFGKPFLREHDNPVSLSHSHPFAAAQIGKAFQVGIDLEQPKQKLLKIAPRILSAGELTDAGDSLIKNCIYWNAKECLYKIYGQRGLSFMDNLRVAAFDAATSGEIRGTIAMDGTALSYLLRYDVFPDFILVRTIKRLP